jgi:recombination protein RecA
VTSERLASDVHELLLGLGIKVTLRKAPAMLRGRQVGDRYRLGFQTDLQVFRLPRKVARLTPLRTRRATLRYVTGVEPVPSVPVRCIQVDHPSHTYLAGRECIPTHNTSLALHAVASAQKAGGIAAFIDAEHALDPEYAKKLGVDTDALLVSQPDTGEQALEIADMLIRSGAIDVVVIDSVAALVPRAEIEGEMGDSHVGLQARLMSQALRKLAGALNQTRTTAIFINQLREKVGVMFGSPETTSGGRALKFYSSVRLDVRRIETLKDGTEPVGSRTRVKVVKNKVASPFKTAEFDILFGFGISREGGLIDLGVEQGIVRKSGAWYTYEGDQLGQGKENARAFLRDNPDLANEVEKKIKEKLGVGPRLDADANADAKADAKADAAPRQAAGGASGPAPNGKPASNVRSLPDAGPDAAVPNGAARGR